MDLVANLESIRQRIKAACDRCDREPNSLTLMAVTKTQPPEIVGAAAELGLLTQVLDRAARTLEEASGQ